MTTRPLRLPLVATDSTVSSGSEAGQSVRLQPSAGLLAQGKLHNTPTAARHQNWWEGTVGDWIAHIDETITANALGSMFLGMSIGGVGTDSIAYDAVKKSWILAHTGATPQARVSYDGGVTAIASDVNSSFANTDGNMVAKNGIVLIGYGTSSSTSHRITRSINGGESFFTISLPSSGTADVRVFWTGTKFFASDGINAWAAEAPGVGGPTGVFNPVTVFPGTGGHPSRSGHALGAGIFAAVAGGQAGGTICYRTSDDGLNWSASPVPPGTVPSALGLTYDPERGLWFLCGGVNTSTPGSEAPALWSSPNLLSWTSVPVAFASKPNVENPKYLRGLAYFRGALVSCLEDHNGDAWIVGSADGGSNWRHIVPAQAVGDRFHVAEDGSALAFLASGTGRAIHITPRLALF